MHRIGQKAGLPVIVAFRLRKRLEVQISRDTRDGKKSYVFGIVPDKVFALHFTEDLPGKDKAYFFLEAARATMSVMRKNILKTSYFEKVLGYWNSWTQALFQSHFGFKNARV
jgi:hypothetical protein